MGGMTMIVRVRKGLSLQRRGEVCAFEAFWWLEEKPSCRSSQLVGKVKRRKSRINEKMKALQNLIPNSNKTDKASMLDEAIEYLKQLQLQVQMLSMRNGLNLHPMYLPGNLQLMQTSTSQMSIDFTNDGGSATNMGVGGMLPLNQDSLQQHSSDILNQSASCYQSLIVPNSTNINNLGCTFHESFQLPIADEFKEEMEAQQQSNMRNLTKKLSSENEDEICGGDY